MLLFSQQYTSVIDQMELILLLLAFAVESHGKSGSAWALMVGFCGSTVAIDLVILCIAIVNHFYFSTITSVLLLHGHPSAFRSSD